MENTGLMMKKSHDLFMASTALILNTIKTNVTDESKQVVKNSIKLFDALMSKQLLVEDIGNIIKRVFNIVSSDLESLKNKDTKLFQLKEKKNGKTIRLIILPGIDLDEAYNLMSNDSKELLWKFVKSLYVASSKLILMVNKSGISESVIKLTNEISDGFNTQELLSTFHSTFPGSTLIAKDDFDPFIGVGTNAGNFSVNDILNAPKQVQEVSSPGIGSMAKMLGVDKMLNLDDLSKQLQNINQKDIDDATENIKKLLGGNVDEGTSDMINMMLKDITQELKTDNIAKGDPINNIVKIAETVAKNMIPKIDPKKVDMNKVWSSTQNLSKNYVDEKGNKVFQGNNNPLSMLTNLMETQMKYAQKVKTNDKSKTPDDEYIKECEDIFKKMGMSNVDLSKLKKMDMSKVANDIDSMGDLVGTKVNNPETKELIPLASQSVKSKKNKNKKTT
jgi:hypothetical protein